MTRQEICATDREEIRQRLERVNTPQEFIEIFDQVMRENKADFGMSSYASCADALLGLTSDNKRDLAEAAVRQLANRYGRQWRYAGD